MILGSVAVQMSRLEPGQEIILDMLDLEDSARYFTTSRIFDYISPEYVKEVINKVNSDEYPEFYISEIPSREKFVLGRINLD